MAEIKLEYHGVVTAKKNSKQIVFNRKTHRPMLVSNSRATSQEHEMVTVFKQQMKQQGWTTGEGDTYCVEIKVINKDHRRRDLDNQATAILDALVRAGALIDDDANHVKQLDIEYLGVDKENPSAQIIIKTISGAGEDELDCIDAALF